VAEVSKGPRLFARDQPCAEIYELKTALYCSVRSCLRDAFRQIAR